MSWSDAPSVENACGIWEIGARISAVSSHARFADVSSSHRLWMPTFAQRGDEAVGEERDQRHDRDRLPGDPPDLLELRRLRAGDLGRALHQIVEVPVHIPDGSSGISVEDRGLQERQDIGEVVLPEHVGRGGDRTFGADDERRRDQDLREVGHHRPVGGRDARAAEVSDRGGPVRPDDDPLAVELAVGDPQIVERPYRAPDLPHAARRPPRSGRPSRSGARSPRSPAARRARLPSRPPRPAGPGCPRARPAGSGTLRARPDATARPRDSAARLDARATTRSRRGTGRPKRLGRTPWRAVACPRTMSPPRVRRRSARGAHAGDRSPRHRGHPGPWRSVRA